MDEIKREREFYRLRGLPCPKDIPPNAGDAEEEKPVADQVAEVDCHRMDEQVNIGLECMVANLKTLKRKFVRVSSQATITHLKKFIAKKVLDGMDKYKDRVQLAATNRMDWPARRCYTTAAAARHGWGIVADKPLRCHN
ncbi:Polycomb group RING finger protein 3 [Homalodisca vitripennis]|nr:Polycomb group RING finger protein 3 [Homalodisca vitripennis]